jgi:hypothetical protein
MRASFSRVRAAVLGIGDTRPGAAGKDRKFVSPDFTVDDAMVNDFKAFVTSQGVKMDAQAFEADQVFIKAMIRYDIDLASSASSRRAST